MTLLEDVSLTLHKSGLISKTFILAESARILGLGSFIDSYSNDARGWARAEMYHVLWFMYWCSRREGWESVTFPMTHGEGLIHIMNFQDAYDLSSVIAELSPNGFTDLVWKQLDKLGVGVDKGVDKVKYSHRERTETSIYTICLLYIYFLCRFVDYCGSSSVEHNTARTKAFYEYLRDEWGYPE